MIVGQDDDESTRTDHVAATILIRCKDEPSLSPHEHEWIADWLRQSRENVACVLDMIDVDQKLDRLKLRHRIDALSTPQPRPPGFALPRPAVRWRSAAAIALCAGLLFFSIREGEPTVSHRTLADGSVMHSLRGCEYNIEFSDKQRLITLGLCEAVFEVAKDPGRPFIVRSQTSDTIAIGTRFGVTATARDTITTVSEGKVRVVVPACADPATGTPLHAGQELRVVTGASCPEPVLAVDAVNQISWAEGWIAFKGETAGQAVKAFNRFSEVRIEITRPGLSSERVKFGRFEFDKPESFADSIAELVDAPVTTKRNVIYIGEPRKPE